ncbi:uncharacterized protein LOC121395009 [Xenopus laevis]|uniref:Uncharacterized protein LOC121395009 n=1 Tax=Xenopus laevis TaxID=8355 RepID=A0A8J1L345_XENLA|nr:uncharacterized protein LOC121395009 [Xenopus laevis]
MSEDSIPSTATTFAYDEADIGRILSKIDAVNLLSTQDIVTTDTEKDLFNLRRKEIHTSLHVSSLAEYIKVKRIPRGLRLDIKPNLCAENNLLQQRWHEICNKCSQDLMLLTVETLTEKLVDIRTEVQKYKEQLLLEKGKDQAEKVISEQERALAKLRETIILRKRNKFERDARDYREGREYTWREDRNSQRTQPGQYSPRYRRTDRAERRPWASTDTAQPQYRRKQRYRTPRQGTSRAPTELTSSSEECSASSSQSSVPFLGAAAPQDTMGIPRNQKPQNTREQYPTRNRKATR